MRVSRPVHLVLVHTGTGIVELAIAHLALLYYIILLEVYTVHAPGGTTGTGMYESTA